MERRRHGKEASPVRDAPQACWREAPEVARQMTWPLKRLVPNSGNTKEHSKGNVKAKIIMVF